MVVVAREEMTFFPFFRRYFFHFPSSSEKLWCAADIYSFFSFKIVVDFLRHPKK
jgi:hypothetical protein